MMTTRRWMGIGLSAVALCLWALAGPSEAAKQVIIIGTAPAGTAAFPYQVGVAQIVNKAVPELALAPQETGGTVANIRLLDAGKIQLSGFSSMVAVPAVQGKPPFKEKMKIKILFNMYSQRYVYFARKASGITSWDQVAGKRIAIGTPAGSTRVVGDLILKSKGLKDKAKAKAKALYLQPSAMIDAMRDGNLDAGYGVVAGGSPAPWVLEVLSTLDVNLYGLDEGTIRQLAQAEPGLFRTEFPQDFFKKGVAGFPTIADSAIMGSSSALDERTAYLITKTVQENLPQLVVYSPAAKGLTPKDAIEGVPSLLSFHPGAVRYYKEKGLMK